MELAKIYWSNVTIKNEIKIKKKAVLKLKRYIFYTFL